MGSRMSGLLRSIASRRRFLAVAEPSSVRIAHVFLRNVELRQNFTEGANRVLIPAFQRATSQKPPDPLRVRVLILSPCC
jgi:hypothetical protein